MDRFWQKVNKNGSVPIHKPELGPCWIWCASKTRKGNGQFWKNGRLHLAHRISWELCNGPIPQKILVCHHCDNPSCVNDSHLFLGTQVTNMQDCIRKGRFNKPFGEKHSAAKLTNNDIDKIRRLYVPYKMSTYKLAKMFGVTKSTIFAIISHQNWNH